MSASRGNLLHVPCQEKHGFPGASAGYETVDKMARVMETSPKRPRNVGRSTVMGLALITIRRYYYYYLGDTHFPCVTV